MPDFQLPTTLYTAQQTRQLDDIAINEEGIPGIVLMKRAGRFAFDALLQVWPEVKNVIVLCGAGNNAGDGYVVAALAAQRASSVSVFTVIEPQKLKDAAKQAWEYAEQENVRVEQFSEEAFIAACAPQTVIVDALLGTGLNREVDGNFASAIRAANQSALPILALDLPSGLDADSGKVWGVAIKASLTTTFIGVKRGLLTGRAPALTGELRYSDLLVPAKCFAKVPASCKRITSAVMLDFLPKREADAHKGKFGHVLVVGGDIGMGGAALLASEAAARSGAGLTSVATQPEHVAGMLARRPELMVVGVPSGQALGPVLEKPDVIVLGPGLGRASWSEQMLQQATLSAKNLVVDADALNLLAEGRVVREQKRETWVLTPHPGEAARLLSCSVADIQNDRFAAAKAIQARYGGVVVLKGAGTIIVSDTECMLAAVGNPGMATGGMGDVLAGVIGALLAQGLSLLNAAALAVCVHGDAADVCAQESGQLGMLASDLIPHIRQLLNRVAM